VRSLVGAKTAGLAPMSQLPNKRLKLSGGDRLEGNGLLCPGKRRLTSGTLGPASESPAA